MSRGWSDPKMRGRAWRNTRRALLDANRRDNQGACQLAIPGVCTGVADQVHHTLGVQATGHDPRYLMCVCKACNLHVGDPLAVPNPPPHPSTPWL